ncbi:hypothetical protein CWO07_24935 [Vibrio splendidus]|uniref:Uncharacterized protein n=1 Tax=Vibrio splendidus TaxID=29497 RepID=A0A2T5EGH7_VIBSP|nr:hypothetical protein CWO07_24935 [Vibrio splendidus]
MTSTKNDLCEINLSISDNINRLQTKFDALISERMFGKDTTENMLLLIVDMIETLKNLQSKTDLLERELVSRD